MKTLLLSFVLCAAMAVTASLTCGSDTCADDELCKSGGTACQCNTSLYTFTASNPSPNITCTGGKFNIEISKCWLEKNGYNTTNIRLDSTDATCGASREIVNGIAQMGIHRALVTSDCGTTSESNGTIITYRNKLYIFSNTVPVQGRKHVVMNISCTYPLNMNNIVLNFTLKPVAGTTEITAPESNATYTVNMVAYDQYMNPLSANSELFVAQPIIISVNIPDLDANSFHLKVVRIYATGDDPTATLFDLLVNGCPDAGTAATLISVDYNGNGTEARFQVKLFQIAGSVGLNLHANLVLCKATDVCVPVCPSQGRAGSSDGNQAEVSVSLPISENPDYSSASGFSMPWTLSALLFSCILAKLM